MRREICTDKTLFTSKNGPKQFYTNISVVFDVRGQQEVDIFTGGSIFMDYRLIFWPWLKVPKSFIINLILTNMQIFNSQDVN